MGEKQVKKNNSKTTEKKKANFINPAISWSILGVELIIVLLIGFLICR